MTKIQGKQGNKNVKKIKYHISSGIKPFNMKKMIQIQGNQGNKNDKKLK